MMKKSLLRFARNNELLSLRGLGRGSLISTSNLILESLLFKEEKVLVAIAATASKRN